MGFLPSHSRFTKYMHFKGFLELQPCCALEYRKTPGLHVGEHSASRERSVAEQQATCCNRANMQSLILFQNT